MTENTPRREDDLKNLTRLRLVRFFKSPSCRGVFWVISHSCLLSSGALYTNIHLPASYHPLCHPLIYLISPLDERVIWLFFHITPRREGNMDFIRCSYHPLDEWLVYIPYNAPELRTLMWHDWKHPSTRGWFEKSHSTSSREIFQITLLSRGVLSHITLVSS